MTDNVFSVLENPKHDVYLDLKHKLLSAGADTAGVSPALTASVVSGLDAGTVDDFVATLPTSEPNVRYIYEREWIDSIQLTKTLVARGHARDEETGNHQYGVASKGIVIHPLGHQLKIVVREILKHNGIGMGVMYRGACNMAVHTSRHPQPHVDHSFPHVGMLIYLNDSEGDTVICNEQEDFRAGPNQRDGETCEALIDSMTTAATIKPEEDKVIIMNGANYHYNMLPPEGAEGRVVIVATFSLR